MKVLCIVLAGGLLTPGLAAADYYRYETVGGTICFTDALDRVPLRYREHIVVIAEAALASYGRLTIVPRGATFAPSYDVWGPVIDEPTGPLRSAARPRAWQRRRIWVDTGGGTAMDLPVDEGPIHVRKRGRWSRDGRMKSTTIIEQDGRERAVIENY